MLFSKTCLLSCGLLEIDLFYLTLKITILCHITNIIVKDLVIYGFLKFLIEARAHTLKNIQNFT